MAKRRRSKNKKIWVSTETAFWCDNEYVVHRNEPEWIDERWTSIHEDYICGDWGRYIFPELNADDPKELLEVVVKQGTVWEPK